MVWVLVAEEACVHQERIPLKPSTLLRCKLRLVHRLELTWRQLLPDNEEYIATVTDVAVELNFSRLTAS